MAQSKEDFAKANGFSSSWASNPNTGSVSSSGSSGSNKSSSSGSSGSSGVTKTSGGYAYTDKYGYSHVVSDYNTAKQYSGDGKVYDYSGNYSGGYARDEKGGRLDLPISGAVSLGSGSKSGGNDYLGGISNPSYNNFVVNAAPTATAAMANKYTPAQSAITAPKLSALPSTSNLVPIRSTFQDAGYGVNYDSGTGNINIYDPKTSNVLDTIMKGAYAMKDGQAYLNKDFGKSTMSLLNSSPSSPQPIPTVPQPIMPEPVPQLDLANLFQYQPFQMSPNLPQMSSGGDNWAPTLSAKQQWYGQQDQLRGDYLTDWYRKQALAQDQAAQDWEKQKYNSPYEQAIRDLAIQQAQAQLQATQALEAQRIAAVNKPSSGGGGGSGRSGGGSGTKTLSASEQRYAWEEGVASTSEYYKSGEDYMADIRRNKSKIIQLTGSAGYRRLEQDAQRMIEEGRTGIKFTPGSPSPIGTALAD